jgi:hypothetical protein
MIRFLRRITNFTGSQGGYGPSDMLEDLATFHRI